MSPADRQVFDNNYLLCGLAQEVKDDIAAMATLLELRQHDSIIGEDAKDVDLVVVLRGKVAIYKGTEKLTEAGAGSVLGEVSLVDNLPRSAHAMAATAVGLAKLDGKKLRSYMFQNRDAGFLMLANLSRVLSGRLRAANDQVEDLKGQAKDPWLHAM